MPLSPPSLLSSPPSSPWPSKKQSFRPPFFPSFSLNRWIYLKCSLLARESGRACLDNLEDGRKSTGAREKSRRRSTGGVGVGVFFQKKASERHKERKTQTLFPPDFSPPLEAGSSLSLPFSRAVRSRAREPLALTLARRARRGGKRQRGRRETEDRDRGS